MVAAPVVLDITPSVMMVAPAVPMDPCDESPDALMETRMLNA
jgi:hypothetical protein